MYLFSFVLPFVNYVNSKDYKTRLSGMFRSAFFKGQVEQQSRDHHPWKSRDMNVAISIGREGITIFKEHKTVSFDPLILAGIIVLKIGQENFSSGFLNTRLTLADVETFISKRNYFVNSLSVMLC